MSESSSDDTPMCPEADIARETLKAREELLELARKEKKRAIDAVKEKEQLVMEQERVFYTLRDKARVRAQLPIGYAEQVARADRREARRKARHQAARAAAPAAQASARGPAAARKKRKAPTAADDPPSAPAGDSSVHPCNTETPGNLNTLWDYAAVPPGASWSCVATHVCSPERAADPMSRRREQRIGEPAAP